MQTTAALAHTRPTRITRTVDEADHEEGTVHTTREDVAEVAADTALTYVQRTVELPVLPRH